MPTPVAVLGNGPVGQTTALLLARWGVPVLLLDARPARDPLGSKAICQQRDVLDIWSAIGVGEQLAAEGVTWTTARTYHRDRELFAHTITDPGQSPFPPFVNISQSRTEALLDQRIAAEPLIEVRWHHEVTSITQDPESVHLTCHTPEGPAAFTADYAVLCAGARAENLRRQLGIEFTGHSFDDRFLICDLRADLPWSQERHFHFDPAANPGRQILIHPCPDSTYRIDWQVPATYDLAEETESGALDARIRAVIGDTPYELVWKSVYRFHSRLATRLRAGRVLLAGDCAHLVAPFGARGLNSGVADAENAAWKLAYVHHGWAPESLLETYHQERHAAARENLEVTTATMNFLVPATEEQHRTRESLLRQPDPSQVDSGRLAEPFWYTDSPLTTAHPRRQVPGRPPRGTAPPTAPGVLVPDAPVHLPGHPATRLRQLARDGFLLLAGPATTLAQPTDPGGAVRTPALPAAPQRIGPGRPLALPGLGPEVGPVRVLDLAEIDPGGALRLALSAGAGEVWLIRPDAHVAAVLQDPGSAELLDALLRAVGRAELTPSQRP